MNRPALAPLLALLAAGGCQGGMGIFGRGGEERDALAEANSVSRRYAKPAPEVWEAVTGAMRDLDLTIETSRHDALGGDLTARRANKEKVLVEARSVDLGSTQVRVAVGQGDANLAEIVQHKIGERLGAARSRLAGGSSLEGVYDVTLFKAMNAAQKAAEALNLSVAHRELEESAAQLDVRRADGTPAQFRMERGEKDRTKVTFTVGNARSPEHQGLAERLKAEFERALP